MLKKILSAVTALLIVANAGSFVSNTKYNTTPLTASAADYTEGTYECVTYKKYSDHIEITDCDESAEGRLVLPDSIAGLPITVIGDHAFSLCSKLYEIVLPSYVKSIGYQAFTGCVGMSSITLPGGLEAIGQAAFSECDNLTEISIPESVTSIGSAAFADTKWLENRKAENPFVIVNTLLIDGTACTGNVVIPEGVTKICDYAFIACEGMYNVSLPQSVESIGYCAFYLCPNLKKVNIANFECKINDSFETILNGYDDNGPYFNGTIYCYENSYAHDYAKKYGYDFYSWGEKYTEVITDNFSYLRYADRVAIARYSKAVEEAEIPAELDGLPVTTIFDAFSDCEKLKKVTIPNSVRELGPHAFWRCTSLTDVTIPENVEKIGDDAFRRCKSLDKITFLNPFCEIPDSELTITNWYDNYDVDYYNGVICGYENSTAQAYAEKYGYKFESLGKFLVILGDVDRDGIIDSSDASLVLADYALTQTGHESALSTVQKTAADVDLNGTIDSSDATSILVTYAANSTRK